MHLTRVCLTDFRNYGSLEFIPGTGLNILVGENAQGKSNLLESIRLLATTRSPRASRDSEMVRHAASNPAGPGRFAIISAELIRDVEGEVLLELVIQSDNQKTARVNGASKSKLVDMVGRLNAVFFGASEIEIVTGDPSSRRRFLNMEIGQSVPKYVYDLAYFKRSLDQRNRLLKELRDRFVRESGIEAWNEQLVMYGTPLMFRRSSFVRDIQPIAAAIHHRLSGEREELIIRYLPSVTLPDEPTLDSIADRFRESLDRVGPDEMRRGTTLVGPQRDDLQFLVNGREARIFGSQGQQRTVALSLKLAEARLLEQYTGEKPVLLLDDVMSDLDENRRAMLMERILAGGQTFLTCTSLSDLPEELLSQASIHRVTAGVVETERTV